MKQFVLPAAAATISAFGQVLLKYAMVAHGPIEPSLRGVFSLLLQPRLIAAFIIYALAMLMWLQVLARTPLSVAYTMLALTYAVVPCLAIFFFDERLALIQVVGIALVLAGVALLGFGYAAR